MNAIFGVPMNAIMIVLVAAFAACVVGVLGVFLSNRIMFRMGLRNVGRRRAQSTLVVCGLMLGTIIITAAFATGDSVDYSVTSTTYNNLQRTDISLHGFRNVADTTSSATDTYASQDEAARLMAVFANDPDVEGMMPFLFETLPVLNARTKLTEPQVIISGLDPEVVERFGGLTLVDGGHPNLGALADDEVLIGARAADKLDARTGDTVTVYTASGQSTFRVAGIVKDERSSGALEFGGTVIPSAAMRMDVLQRLTGHVGQINSISVVLRGGVRGSVARTDVAAERLEAFKSDRHAQTAANLSGLNYQVEKVKQDAVEQAALAGSLFTTMFMIMGLFSISAGIMLIFMLFVMLASERRREMGIARAVGATRANLVQSFVAEGLVYDIIAGLVGVVLGIVAAFVLVIGGMRLVAGDQLSFVQAHVTTRTLVVSFCLGAVLTFATVVLSSLRISQLNIVAAIRGSESKERSALQRQGVRWGWFVAAIPALVVPPLGLYFLLRKALGIPWAWIIGPAGVVLGGLLIWLGELTNQSFWLTLGASLIPIGCAALARTVGVRSRPAWSTAGAALAIYWLVPYDITQKLFGKVTGGGMEMFVLSGIMVVIGFTLVIVYNARLLNVLFAPAASSGGRYRVSALLWGLAAASVVAGFVLSDAWDGLGQLFYMFAGFFAVFGALAVVAVRFPAFAPALKMGIAYPLSNRFRTGMTIAMFSLVIFSITVMAIMNGSFLQLFASDEARGGWDIEATTNRNNPVPDFAAALAAEGSVDPTMISASGRLSAFGDEQQVRMAGAGGDWSTYAMRAADDAYWTNAQMALESRAAGYATDRAVYEAVRDQPNLAVIDSLPMQNSGYNMGAAFTVDGVTVKDHVFQPFQLEVRDPVTGKTETLTVIGALSGKIPSNLLFGVFMSERTYTSVYGAPQYIFTDLRLAPGTDAKVAAKAIKAALVTRGVQAVSIQQEIDDTMAQSRGFLRIFQAFMGLGLFVGIAALGVIALRSVVERRQQIGMLRAIGYQRGAVALSFILESGFIALTGVLSGVVGAAILSWRILTSDEMKTNQTVGFYMPWVEIIVYIVLAMGFALLMTWWPSRRASSVPIAEALRYE